MKDINVRFKINPNAKKDEETIEPKVDDVLEVDSHDDGKGKRVTESGASIQDLEDKDQKPC